MNLINKRHKITKLILILFAGLFVCLSLFGGRKMLAEAAMENNAYTKPFTAPYYAPQDATVKKSATTYSTGWQQSGGRWYYMITPTTYYADGWKVINDKWYYFDSNGYCVTGWIKTTTDSAWGTNGTVLYFDPVNAWMVTGYQKIDNIGRYFTGNGYLVINSAVEIAGKYYLIDKAGVCSTGTLRFGKDLVNATSVFDTISKDDVISGDYEFQAVVNENTSIETFGFTPIPNQKRDQHIIFCRIPDNSLKGKFGIWFRNVGTYKGRQIDLKETIVDYELEGLYGSELGMIGFNKAAPGIAIAGVTYAEAKYEYFDHETGERVSVKGYATIDDIDFSQSCMITSDYDKIYVTDQCELYYTSDDQNHPIFTDGFKYNVRDDDPNGTGAVTVYYTSDSFSFKFYNNYALWKTDTGNYFYNGFNNGQNPHFTIEDEQNDPELGLHSWQGYALTRFARVTTPNPPAKTVTDTDETDVTENTLTSISEGFSYKISQNVPLQPDSKYYYSNYKITDQLEPCLTYVSAKVIDDGGKDMTNLYTIKASGQTVTFTCKDPSNVAFYGKNYHYIINVKINPASDLSPYLENGIYIIPNTASLTVKSAYEDETYDTNTVKTKINVVVNNCSISLTKKSKKDGSLLKDAEFTLYEWNGSKYTEKGKLQNNNDGTYTMTGLTYTPKNEGWYKIVETKNPEGFTGKYEKEFQISKEGGDQQKFTYDAFNESVPPQAYITVTKVNRATGDVLEDAEFSLYEWNETTKSYSKDPVQILEYRELRGIYRNPTPLKRTDQNAGWFKVVETKNPEGYIGTWEQEFQIADANGGTQEFQYTAKNTKLMTLTINKTIYVEDFYSAHGNATFLFDVAGTDIDGVERSYSRAVTFTEDYVKQNAASDGTVTLSAEIKNIPSGTYSVKEKKVSRYALTEVTAQTDNVVIKATETGTNYGNIRPIKADVSVDLSGKNGELTFTNRKITWDNFSHTDEQINRFTINK